MTKNITPGGPKSGGTMTDKQIPTGHLAPLFECVSVHTWWWWWWWGVLQGNCGASYASTIQINISVWVACLQ